MEVVLVKRLSEVENTVEMPETDEIDDTVHDNSV